MPRAIAGLIVLCLATAASAAAPDPLAAARAHLKAGKFDEVIDDLADTSKLPRGPTAQIFADAAQQALQKQDRSFAGLYCERALGLEPREARALRVCAAVAVQEKRFEEAERWGDTLGSLLPKDAEVALLRAQAAQGRESWQMVVALLEPHQGHKALQGQIAPLLAEARKHAEAPTSGATAAAGSDSQEDKIATALRTAREEARRKEAQAPEPTPASKKWRPMGEKVVVYTLRKCGECDSAKAWLAEHEVEFEEKDADRSGQAYREALRICAKGRKVSCNVPIIIVNEEVVSGFDVVRLKSLLNL